MKFVETGSGTFFGEYLYDQVVPQRMMGIIFVLWQIMIWNKDCQQTPTPETKVMMIVTTTVIWNYMAAFSHSLEKDAHREKGCA